MKEILDQLQTHEVFYIRTGPSTTDLRLSKVYAYIKERFDENDNL